MKKHNKRNRTSRMMKATPNFTGQHFLHNPKTIKQLLVAAKPKSNDTVLEIGAGGGSLTLALAEHGAKVTAIEVDQSYVQQLRSKMIEKGYTQIKIIEADIRTYRLPSAPFCVIANIPFSITTPILVKLLGNEGKALQKATLIVEYGAAKRFTQQFTADWRLLAWRMLFTFKLGTVIPRSHFAPPPKVDAAILIIERRAAPLIAVQDAGKFAGFASYVLQEPNQPAAEVLRGIFTPAQLKRVLPQAAITREKVVKEITVEQWGILFNTMLKHVPFNRWPKR